MADAPDVAFGGHSRSESRKDRKSGGFGHTQADSIRSGIWRRCSDMPPYRSGCTPFPAWVQRVRSLLTQTETRYDLAEGEVLLATGTDQRDLRELWGYGWTPAEAARTIEEALGLR